MKDKETMDSATRSGGKFDQWLNYFAKDYRFYVFVSKSNC